MNSLTSKNTPTYLVCVNKENYSNVALRFACKLAVNNNGKVIILHVIEPADFQGFGIIAKKMLTEQRNEAKALLKTLAKEAKEWIETPPTLLLREGRIEDEIVSVIEEDNKIGMLLAGSSSDSNVKSKILPPLVAQLGLKLQIPMLIIPGSLTDLQIDELTS